MDGPSIGWISVSKHIISTLAPAMLLTERLQRVRYWIHTLLQWNCYTEKCSPEIFLEMKILDLGKVWRRSEAGSAGLEAQVAPDISLQSLILQDFDFFKPHNVYVIFHRGLKACWDSFPDGEMFHVCVFSSIVCALVWRIRKYTRQLCCER